MKKSLHLFLAAFLVISMVACGGGKSEIKPITKDYEDRTLEILEMQRGAKLKVGSAEDGQEVVLLKVKLTNKADKPLSVNNQYFDIAAGGEGSASMIRVFGVDGKLKLQKLEKGKSAEGYIAASASKGAELTLKYKMDALGKRIEDILLK